LFGVYTLASRHPQPATVGAGYPARLYETPFTDLSPKGVEGVFNPEQIAQIIAVLDGMRVRASA